MGFHNYFKVYFKKSFDERQFWSKLSYGLSGCIFPLYTHMYDIAEKCYRYDFFLLFLKILPIQSFLFWKIMTPFIGFFFLFLVSEENRR